MKVLISTGSLVGRANCFDYASLKSIAQKVSCDGFEFMMYTSIYDRIDEVVACLAENEIYTPVLHCDKHIGEFIAEGTDASVAKALNKFDINCKVATQIHAEKIVLHLWSGRISDQYFERNLAAYEKIKEIADSYQLDLLIENVVCNKETCMRRCNQLADMYPNVHFTYDTKMAAFHGEENAIYDKEFEWMWTGKHVKHFHINDYGSEPMDWNHLLGKVLPIGAGHLDFGRFFQFLQKKGYNDTFTIEASACDDSGNIDCEMLKQCVKDIKSYFS